MWQAPMHAESSSEDDEMEIPRPRVFRQHEELFDSFDPQAFRQRFRLSKKSVQRLTEILRNSLEPKSSAKTCISATQQILIALSFYATGCFQLTYSDLFGVSKSSVSRVVLKVTEAICSLAPKLIKMPKTTEEITTAKASFYNMIQPHGIPNVIGLIDCTHVKIITPGEREAERFRNRKSYFSINTQVICDYNLKFLDVVARWPGSVHDAYIFDMSLVKARFLRLFPIWDPSW